MTNCCDNKTNKNAASAEGLSASSFIKQSQATLGSAKRMIDPVLAGIAIVTLVLLVGAVYVGSSLGATPQVEVDDRVDLNLGQDRYNWGVIDLNDGLVTTNFLVENKGSVPLQLYNVRTSCTCTTAQIRTEDRLSKKFGMHDRSSEVFEVEPGKTAKVLVEFDPAFHGPSGVGSIVRTVNIDTNDPSQPQILLQMTADVVNRNLN